ncbi:MAG: fused MFS/spermidine synthase [candidate division Zixibacteria bacterium]|nr:fused MFS/spermidine synthase [candidate division Zixibacteria bacterium]
MQKSGNNGGTLFKIHTVIFLTGFTFLLYEVCWNRMLSLALGTTVTASTLVLAAFMAGFGTGAWYWGKKANRSQRFNRLLALLLGGIGFFGALNYFLISNAIPGLYSALSVNGMSMALMEVIVFVFSALLLFIPAFFIGGVFPVICRMSAGYSKSISSLLGRLYAIDTLGAALGGLITGFILLRYLGQMQTMFIAVAINLLLAIWMGISKEPSFSQSSIKDKNDESKTLEESFQKKPNKSTTLSYVKIKQIALIGTFVCGFAMLSLQVFWIRMFRIYFTNTSYTFALISSLVILGLFVGSVLFKRWSPSIDNFAKSMCRTILWLCVTTAAGLVLLIYLPEVLMFPFRELMSNPQVRVFILPIAASLLIVLPPAVFSGYAFPLACRMYSQTRETIGGDVGFVLMVNTIGSVIGPIVAAFVLLPLLGAVMSVAMIIYLLGIYILFLTHRALLSNIYKISFYAIIAILFAVIIYNPEIKILPPSFSRIDREVLFYRESVEGTLTVGRDSAARGGDLHTYVNNSAVIGSEYDAIKVVKMVGHFPFFLGLDCKDVLVIGFGIGVTASAIASHPEVESIECVELVEGLKDAAVFYKDLNRNVINDPRLKIMAGDGRHYLQMTPKKYDLISCDPTHPILGSGNLYTADYFALCKEHLNPGGMVSQYLPLHKLRTQEFLGIIKTFQSEFPHCTVWLGHYHAVLLGSTEPIQINFAEWQANIAKVGQDNYFFIDPYHLAATLVLDGQKIEQLGAESKINTDDHSYTEFFNAGCLDSDNIAKNLRFLMEERTDVGTVFSDIADPVTMTRYIMGNQLLTESLFYKLSGDRRKCLQSLKQAAQVNPENKEYPFLLKLYN